MKKILLVEDERSLNELYAEILTDSGYDVSCALDGQQALEMIEGQEWDMLLLDIMLPKLDGVEVLKKLKESGVLEQKPVVVLSNLEDSTIITKCLSLGARDFLVKSSVEPSDVVASVQKLLPEEKNE